MSRLIKIAFLNKAQPTFELDNGPFALT